MWHNLKIRPKTHVILLTRFGQICIFLLLISGYQDVYPVLLKIFIPFFYVAPACSYLYVRNFIHGETRIRKLDWLHLIPAVFAVIHVLPIPWAEPLNWDTVANQILIGGQLSVTEPTGLFPAYFYSTGQSLLLVVYLIAAWYVMFSSGFIKKKQWDINRVWLVFFLSIASFFKLLSFVVLIFDVSGRPYLANPVFIMVSCMVLLFMMVFVLYQPRILYGYVIVSAANTRGENIAVKTKRISSRNNLSAQQQQAYINSIQQLMESQQPFLLPDFQMIHLAQQLQIPLHHCSLTINSVMGKNFRDWLNSYRIQYFINQYPALAEKMTIETVAYQSGFKNATTFYNAFKKETGEMPTTYFLKKEV